MIQFETMADKKDIRQKHGSAGTSLNQVPKVFKVVADKIGWKAGTLNVDIGGGRFDTSSDYLRGYGVQNLVFDTFNRQSDHNRDIAISVKFGRKADSVTCCNVLNVIDSAEVRRNVILQCAKALKPEGTAYIGVYAGNGSGIGAESKKDCWQNNQPLEWYIPEVERYFGKVVKKYDMLICTLPVDTDEKSVWYFDDRQIDGEVFGMGKTSDKEKIATALTITIFEKTPTFRHPVRQPQGENAPYTNCQPSSNLAGLGVLTDGKDIDIFRNKLKKLLKNWNIADAHTFALVVSNNIGAEPSEERVKRAKEVSEISYYLNLPQYSLRIGLHNVNAENYTDERNRPSNYGVTFKDIDKPDTFKGKEGVKVTEYVYIYHTKERLKTIAEAILHLLETGEWDENIAPADYKNPDDTGTKGLASNSSYTTNQDIVKLVESKDTFSEAEKELLRRYSGNGGFAKQSMKTGALYEYYTPDYICEYMYLLAKKYGFDKGNILEPSCATGNIIKPFYERKDFKNIDCFEIDGVSRKICKVLYPIANIYPQYFETAFLEPPRYTTKAKDIWLPNYPYDLVIGNPPYTEHKNKYSSYFVGKDKFKRAEMFFIYKGLQLLKSKGLLIYITASNFISTGSDYQDKKELISSIADFVDGYRLPSVFDKTKVCTDIIVLQKK